MTTAPPSDPELEAAVWDLGPLVDGRGDAGLTDLITDVVARASAFADTYRGRVADLDAAELLRAVEDLNVIHDLLQRADAYAFLRGAGDGADLKASAAQGAVGAAKAEIDTHLLFFALEWIAIDDDRVEALLAAAGDGLGDGAYHLRHLRGRRAFLLSPPEEAILAQTSVQRRAAWQRLYFENAATLTLELDGETLPFAATLSAGLVDPDRSRREAIDAAVATGFEVGLASRVAAYNQVLGDSALTDRLRGYPGWLSAHNLVSDLSDAAVQRRLDAIDARTDIARRWYRLKARLLGLERLSASDLWAPLPDADESVSFARSREIICASWSAFAPSAGEIIAAFFGDGRIDAPVRANKQGGAFCAPAGPGRAPYLLVNYESRPTSTMTLAHELGHGLHAELARGCGALQYEGSMPMAEVASTFSEALVGESLRNAAPNDAARLALLVNRINDAIICVFETRAELRGEAAMHAYRREHGEFSAAICTELWTAAHVELWQDAVVPTPGYMTIWGTMPHLMLDPPGYNQSYSFGLLTAWAAYARYRATGPAFAADYLGMLAAGGSRSPADLVAMLGLDIADPGYWDVGLDMVNGLIDEAEGLAAALLTPSA